LALRRKQLSLLRAPKLWPLQTVEMLLPLTAMAVEDPHAAEVAAVLRASIENSLSSSWTSKDMDEPQLRRRPEIDRQLTEQDAEDVNHVNHKSKNLKRA
jgi:hypothetical protein